LSATRMWFVCGLLRHAGYGIHTFESFSLERERGF
jgi:hypothetical protein